MANSEPRMIVVELSSGSETHISRCCPNPAPVAMGTSLSHNTSLYSCVVKCSHCKTELVVLRWRLPQQNDVASMLDGEPARRRLDTV